MGEKVERWGEAGHQGTRGRTSLNVTLGHLWTFETVPGNVKA